jgi:hypothetical protein
MEVILKLLERVIFTRINKVIDDNNMLRSEQYGGINGRQMQDPIRILAELIEDANVTKKELHIFSADLSKAFDTLEYWSQAMSWRALGAPKEMVNMLVDMDKGGRTAVILAPDRTTETISGEKGTYANARGVRQGSVGGPIKWVVFMNFWLEYVHNTAEGRGYKMNKSTIEIIGQMFIDDNNWISTNAEDMTEIVKDCNTFVSFHGLKFNQKKCEYMAINQQDSRREGSEYAAWELPKWPPGENIMPKARQVEERHKWEKEHADIIDQLNRYEGGCMDMDDPEKEHPVTEQPKKEALVRVKVMNMKWKRDIQAGEDGRVQAEQRRESVTKALNRMKTKAYGEATEEEVKESTEAWAMNWQQWVGLEIMHSTNIEQATKYLGVFFNMNLP